MSSSSEALTADARAIATPRLAGGPFDVYAATETVFRGGRMSDFETWSVRRPRTL